MAKRHGRPSVQYRYEHYDPRFGSGWLVQARPVTPAHPSTS
jgi:hypothetical protein